MVFDSFGGIRLDDGSVLSPDASVPCAVSWHAYTANGARLGWLLFPEQRTQEIWRAGDEATDPGESLRSEPALALEGGELLPGLRLELAEIWSS